MNLTGQGIYQKGSKRTRPKLNDRSLWDEIRSLGCIICNTPNPHLHHILTGAGGRKDDSKVIPLCHFHHVGGQGIHFLGRKAWQLIYGTELELYEQVMIRIKPTPA